MAIDLSFWLNG